MPLKAFAVVFAVPCPLEGHRPDLLTVTGGIVQMDAAKCSPRRFHVLLPHDQVRRFILFCLKGVVDYGYFFIVVVVAYPRLTGSVEGCPPPR